MNSQTKTNKRILEENYCELLLLAGSDYNLVIFMPLIVLEQYPQFNVSNE